MPFIKTQADKEASRKLMPEWNDGNFPNLGIAIKSLRLLKEVPREDSPRNTEFVSLDNEEIMELMGTPEGMTRIEANLKAELKSLQDKDQDDSSFGGWVSWGVGMGDSDEQRSEFRSNLTISLAAIEEWNKLQHDRKQFMNAKLAKSQVGQGSIIPISLQSQPTTQTPALPLPPLEIDKKDVPSH